MCSEDSKNKVYYILFILTVMINEYNVSSLRASTVMSNSIIDFTVMKWKYIFMIVVQYTFISISLSEVSLFLNWELYNNSFYI